MTYCDKMIVISKIYLMKRGCFILDIGIVTGASSGLGREYARLLDGEGLEEIWLIARRQGELQQLAGELKTRARILPLDLTEKESIVTIEKALNAEKPTVRYLINGAGFGKIGSEEDIDLEAVTGMIDLNCNAAAAMTYISVPYMEKGSHILQICSCSAFQPIPYLNTYAATKAFLLHYSRGLAVELSPKGITVSAICPYWIKDTEFIANAQKTRNSSYIGGFPFAGKQKDIAAYSFKAAKQGKTVITPDPVSSLHRILTSILPYSFLMFASKWFHRGR